MKKSLALVLALVMVLSSFSFVSAAPDFADVKGTAYEEPVSRLELLNVLKGYPDGSFKPEGSITRAEFAAVAVRARGLAGVAEAAKGLPSGFVDVPATHWSAGYVGTAGSMGIVNGIGNGMFAPNGLVKYEEAVTMLVRALGYEFEAQAKGGYPYGYLIVAEDIGLLDGARGTQGVFATRGLVAMLTDNALEIPMMIQDGTGKWIVSGEDRTEEVYLLDYMGFDAVEGRVISYSSSRDTITLQGEGTFDVAEDFDYYKVNGVTIKAWVKDDMVVVYTMKDTVKFDAVKNYDSDEITLIGEDAEYDVNSKAVLVVNGVEKTVTTFVADYAKVVLNDDDEVIWAEGYTFDGFMLVNEMDEDVAIDLNDEELDLEDFTVVKDGSTLSNSDIAKNDIVFYNNAEDFAVIYNNSAEGVIDRVYTSTTFRMDGTRYAFTSILGDELYLDGEDLGVLTEVEVRQMMDEEGTVELFFDFAGNVVLIVGDRGVAATSSYYAYVTANPTVFQKRNVNYINLDVITADGEEVEFDVKLDASNVTGSSIVWNPAGTANDLDAFAKGNVVKITVEEDGDLDKYTTLVSPEIITTSDAAIKVTDKYVKTKMLQGSAAVFNVENYSTDVDDIEVYKWSDAADEFTYVEAGHFYYNTADKVVVIVATQTDADDDSTEYYGLVTRERKISGKNQWEITIEVEGTKSEFDTDTNEITSAPGLEGKFAKVKVGDKSGLIIKAVEVLPVDSTGDLMFVVKVIDRDEIELADTSTATTGAIYMMVSGSVVYEKDNDKTSLGELAKGDKVEVYLDKDGSKFVKYIRLNTGYTAPDTGITMVYTSPAAITLTNLTAPTTYAVRVKTESSGLPVGVYGVSAGGVAAITPADIVDNVVYTAELIKIDAPSTVIKSINFVADI